MYFLGGISGGLLLENKKSGFPTAVHSIREKIQATISLIYGNEDHASDTWYKKEMHQNASPSLESLSSSGGRLFWIVLNGL